MNPREGMRRLALLLGVVGVILGGFASYLEMQDVQRQKARHDQFEIQADSDVLQRLRKDHQESKDPSEANIKTVMPGCCGIREVVWDTEHVWNDASGIYSIETDSGENLYPTPAPAIWDYVLVALFPVFGFFIPWGVIRAIGWVGAGFVQPAK